MPKNPFYGELPMQYLPDILFGIVLFFLVRWWWKRVQRSTAVRSKEHSPEMIVEYPLIRMSYASEELCYHRWSQERGHLVVQGRILVRGDVEVESITFRIPDENIAELRLQYVSGYGWALVDEKNKMFYESDTDNVVGVHL
jgi:hypothetical protein